MEQIVNVIFQQRCVGTAKIRKLGLYYEFICTCALPKEGIYRLWAKGDTDAVNLGICVPMDESYGIVTRVPIRKLGEGPISIELYEKSDNPESHQDTSADEPLLRLQDLDKAYLTEPGICFRD